MMDFNSWTLEAIREEDGCFSWMEELRFNWIPQVQSAVKKILEGNSVIIVTDREFKWYSDYILDRVNQLDKNRPFIPIYNIDGIFPSAYNLNDAQELDVLYDMLDISFVNGYFFWYIGSGNHKHYEYIEQDKGSLIWRLNKEIEGLFSLNRNDPQIDIKLIQSFKLFEKALDAALVGEIEV
jgi:hypothetical protein